MPRILIPLLLLLLSSGCASYGTISNQPLSAQPDTPRYSVSRAVDANTSKDIILVLTFSGGGTRAAALAYGVLEGMRDLELMVGGESTRLVDQVDLISSVSGGSFTAAYYGLFGERLFSDFRGDFLTRDVAGELISGLFNPTLWFSSTGRTEMAVNFYEQKVFRGATFADLIAADGPVIVINASDLARGVRFSFLQDYFDLLCSDLSTFNVSRAVAASSAVPILFNPVVLKNYPECDQGKASLIARAREQAAEGSDQLRSIARGLASFADKEQRQYIHLVDGGITDNLGLQSITEMVELSGGVKPFINTMKIKPAPYLLVVSVNASTTPEYQMESSNRIPSIDETINAMADVQLHRNNANTVTQFKESMQQWADELSTDDFKINNYFVSIDFASIRERERRRFFNQIPVSFTLEPQQIEELIQAGRELVLDNNELHRFIDDFHSN